MYLKHALKLTAAVDSEAFFWPNAKSWKKMKNGDINGAPKIRGSQTKRQWGPWCKMTIINNHSHTFGIKKEIKYIHKVQGGWRKGLSGKTRDEDKTQFLKSIKGYRIFAVTKHLKFIKQGNKLQEAML